MQNPLESYRRTQRELRRHFESFTRENCPTCPTPCCRRPARILPTDIQLAESTGWKGRIIPLEASAPPQYANMEAEAEAHAFDNTSGQEENDSEALSCEYLGEKGCTFPTDLRPFGCTAYICKYMYARLDRKELARIKRLVRELEDRHHILLRTLRNVQWKEEL